jgi:hypothetical protein
MKILRFNVAVLICSSDLDTWSKSVAAQIDEIGKGHCQVCICGLLLHLFSLNNHFSHQNKPFISHSLLAFVDQLL